MSNKIAILICLVFSVTLHAMEREIPQKNAKNVMKAQQRLIKLVRNLANDNKFNEDDVLKELQDVVKVSIDINVVVNLAKSRAQKNAGRSDSYTLLQVAVRLGFERVVDFALTHGANPTCYDRLGLTPLHSAASNGMTAGVRRLLESGADITACTLEKRSVMHCAAVGGNHQIIKILYDAYLKQFGEIEALEFLDQGDKMGNAPLHYLVVTLHQLRDNRLECDLRFVALAQMIQLGANVDICNKLKVAPLHLAVQLGVTDIIPVLIEAGADVNARDYTNMTPLHVAMQLPERANIISLLLEAGADINAINGKNLSPVQAAQEQNNQGAIEVYEREIKEQREREEEAREKREDEERKRKEEQAVREADARMVRLRPIRLHIRPHQQTVLRLQQRLREFITRGSLHVPLQN